RERRLHPVPQAAPRRVPRPVHRLLREPAPSPDVRPRCPGRSGPRTPATDLLAWLHDQNQYLPLGSTAAANDQFVMWSLRPGNVHAALGADDDLAYLVTRLRQTWPDVALPFRGACALGVPDRYEVCERLRVSYTCGLRVNAALPRATEGLLADAVAADEADR